MTAARLRLPARCSNHRAFRSSAPRGTAMRALRSHRRRRRRQLRRFGRAPSPRWRFGATPRRTRRAASGRAVRRNRTTVPHSHRASMRFRLVARATPRPRRRRLRRKPLEPRPSPG
ncbi:MAG: hypothetical protein ACK56F_01865, partial [bacterium]